ncbi:MAG: hypothetical protein MRJ68_19700 [Nitrospira sp.]|nr:hypothetical protein [Nitrospira sp.]
MPSLTTVPRSFRPKIGYGFAHLLSKMISAMHHTYTIYKMMDGERSVVVASSLGQVVGHTAISRVAGVRTTQL